jgi:hypothetical protein
MSFVDWIFENCQLSKAQRFGFRGAIVPDFGDLGVKLTHQLSRRLIVNGPKGGDRTAGTRSYGHSCESEGSSIVAFGGLTST